MFAQKIKCVELVYRRTSDTTGLFYEKGQSNPFTGYCLDYYFPDKDSLIDKETHYVNGRMVGPYKAYSMEQNIIEQYNYDENSHKSGEYKKFYSNGVLEVDGFYTDDLKTDAWIFYDNNGRVTTAGHYIMGNKFGVWGVFNKDRKRIKDIIYNEKGEIENIIEY